MTTATKTDQNAFALALYHQLATGSNGNLIFSPHSISAALSQVFTGASGQTAEQMSNVLGLENQSVEDVLKDFSLIKLVFQSNGDHELNLATRLLLDGKRKFEKPWLDLIARVGTPISLVDFSRHQQKIIADVNQWVEVLTHGKIRQLLSADSINAETLFVLVNAIYFKGKWTHQFDVERTREKDFFSAAGKTVQVQMMHQTARFNYLEADISNGLQIVELTYQNSSLAMLVILPKEKNLSLDDWSVKTLCAENLRMWQAAMRPRNVEVYLPRFNIAGQTIELAEVLKAMGMPDAFDENLADFSNMYKVQPPDLGIYLGEAIHKAMIEVDEEGTEAAAATSFTGQAFTSSGLDNPPIFRADHPFIFAIMEKTTGTVVFLGRVMDPTA